MSKSQAIEDYAKAVYVLGIDRDGLVPSGEVATRLGVTPATATAMLQKLAELGLADYTPYKGVALTEAAAPVLAGIDAHTDPSEAFEQLRTVLVAAELDDVGAAVPDDPTAQLEAAIRAVFRSRKRFMTPAERSVVDHLETYLTYKRHRCGHGA